jgi:hypothetical protein
MTVRLRGGEYQIGPKAIMTAQDHEYRDGRDDGERAAVPVSVDIDQRIPAAGVLPLKPPNRRPYLTGRCGTRPMRDLLRR